MRVTPRAYATALRAVVPNLATFEQCVGDLRRIADILRTDATVRAFLTNRSPRRAERIRVVAKVVQGTMVDAAVGLLRLLLVHHALALLPKVVDVAAQLVDIEANRSRILVESAQPLTASVRTQLTTTLRTALHREPIMTYAVHPSLIAGVRVTIDGTRQWDVTVAGRLHQLERHLHAIA